MTINYLNKQDMKNSFILKLIHYENTWKVLKHSLYEVLSFY